MMRKMVIAGFVVGLFGLGGAVSAAKTTMPWWSADYDVSSSDAKTYVEQHVGQMDAGDREPTVETSDTITGTAEQTTGHD